MPYQLKELGKSLRNTLRCEKHAKQRVETARKQAREVQTKNRQLSARAEASRRRLEELEQRNDVLADRNQALTKRLSRVPVQTQRAIQKAISAATSRAAPLGLTLKQGGIITDEARDMVRELVAIHDVPVLSVNGVVEAVSCAAGLEVRGSLSVRSVGRIMLEGDVAATVQMVDEVTKAKGKSITLSSDSTTHKNTNYQSHHITYTCPEEGRGVTRFAGILHEVNHTSDTQLNGWKDLINQMYTVYNECMGTALDWREFVEKVKGMLTDHAEDQKKLVRLFLEWKQTCEREVCGERALATLPPDDITAYAWKMMQGILQDAGGPEGWEALAVEEQNRRLQHARCTLYHEIGVENFSLLSQDEKDATDFFIWGGCCMHKELNAVKGADVAMTAWWQANGIEPPILLMNHDNTATASSGSSTATSHAIHVSKRGAVKALDLTGFVFRNTNDKKGQQDAFRYYLEAQLGYFLPWPDTSNTRYQSHCDGASMWLVYRPLYIAYLEIIRDRKDSRTLTNIELNVFNAFRCPKTVEEMACLSMWGNCIGHPYMRQVRGKLRGYSNLLDLGPLHSKLTDHINHVISNVDLVVASNATYQTATLDGKPFERPEAFYVVQAMSHDTTLYPHFRSLLVTFLRGALNTLTRFTTEFAPDGPIAKSTPMERQLARMETTNDMNEGALGTLRVTMRRAPRMSLTQFNARLKFKKNQTGSWMQSFLSRKSRKYLRNKARKLDASGIERKRRLAQVEYDRQLVQKHREDDKRKAKRKSALTAKFDAFIRWHRRFDIAVPRAKDLPKKKEEKLVVLRNAVTRYTTGVTNLGDAKMDENGEDRGL
ncbi:hypothetical protein BU15DRAFT_68173 [Melanogaster broomeanus]|nr:hypothetical protein BU15DRAFT_68173 [Melanogaster broomeanus]